MKWVGINILILLEISNWCSSVDVILKLFYKFNDLKNKQTNLRDLLLYQFKLVKVLILEVAHLRSQFVDGIVIKLGLLHIRLFLNFWLLFYSNFYFLILNWRLGLILKGTYWSFIDYFVKYLNFCFVIVSFHQFCCQSKTLFLFNFQKLSVNAAFYTMFRIDICVWLLRLGFCSIFYRFVLVLDIFDFRKHYLSLFFLRHILDRLILLWLK